MSRAGWYINRLKAMSISEVLWRLEQKGLCEVEYLKYSGGRKLITDNLYSRRIPNVSVRLLNNRSFSVTDTDKTTIFTSDVSLVDKVNWHQSFMTNNSWPDTFSYKLRYKQCDNIGDARTNWELNRHYFLPQIAKNFYTSGCEKYLTQFKSLFYDWIEKNPFLTGISWTSIMEVAIRAFQWYVSLVFLENSKGFADHKLSTDLKKGILNMMEYVYRHYSRYSSANNHLIVEMTMLGIIGQAFGINKWVDLSVRTLKRELVRQNFEDGVNKEQSIHYQTFVMEAMALLMWSLKENNLQYPSIFDTVLKKMCEFVADLMDINGCIANIGDNDEGKILDLCGGHFNHYTYVLQLCSVVLGINYCSFRDINQSLRFLFEDRLILSLRENYDNSGSKCYKAGGYSILKYKHGREERILTFDHAELGFGAIAAHGHADSLAVTLSVNGEQLLVDPGTYIYHVEIGWRDYFRKTENHSTVSLNSRDQSEMQGAFLWGRRANTHLNKFESTAILDRVEAWHDGYSPAIHRREIIYYKPDLLIITDYLERSLEDDYSGLFFLDPDVNICNKWGNYEVNGKAEKIYISCSENLEMEERWISREYGKREKSYVLKYSNNTSRVKKITTYISIGRNHVVKDGKVLLDNDEYLLDEQIS